MRNDEARGDADENAGLQQSVASSVEARSGRSGGSVLLLEQLEQIGHGAGSELDLQQELRRRAAGGMLESRLVDQETDLLVRGANNPDVLGVSPDAAMDVGRAGVPTAELAGDASQTSIDSGSARNHRCQLACATAAESAGRAPSQNRVCNRLLHACVAD
jgi:hypothetical protein